MHNWTKTNLKELSLKVMAPFFNLNSMEKIRVKQHLFQFAYFPTYGESIEYLATKLAEPEEWEFSGAPQNKYSILKSYLEHTFRKIEYEEGIAYTPDKSYACFNTGLMTKNLEEIYAFFEKIKNVKETVENPANFIFMAFLKQSNIHLITTFPDNLPERTNYFQKPADLIFNPNCKIIPQIDHIIEENRERFPAHIRDLDGDEIRRRLDGSIEEVKKKVKTNYQIAVPQYYDNKIQLLLPLCLTPFSKNPDLALVIHKISADVYTARTCLTIKMAYNNARLIVKPQSSWLNP